MEKHTTYPQPGFVPSLKSPTSPGSNIMPFRLSPEEQQLLGEQQELLNELFASLKDPQVPFVAELVDLDTEPVHLGDFDRMMAAADADTLASMQ